MKKAKFWLSQIIMVAIISLALSSAALAEKPTEKKNNGKTTTTTSSKGKGNDSGSDSGSETVGSLDGTCPDGYVWLDLYGFCIPI